LTGGGQADSIERVLYGTIATLAVFIAVVVGAVIVLFARRRHSRREQ